MAKDETTWMRRWPIQYGAALAAMTFAFLSWRALGRSLGSELPTYITFYPSIMIVSLVVGIRQGLFATLTAVLMAAYWIFPRDGLVVRRLGDIVGLALFTTTSIVVAVMAESYHRSRERAAAYEGTLAASRYTRTLIEASPDPLVTIGREGKITDVNQATESVTGATREQLIGSDFCDYFSEPEKARVGYQQVFAAGFIRDYPLAIRHTSGRITDVLYNATVFRNQKGEIEGVFAAARDITERKRAEEKLRQLAAIVEYSDDAIYSKDLQGTVLTWNRGAERIYGYTAEEIIGQHVSRLGTPEDGHDVERILGSICRGETIDHYETVRMRKGGTHCDVSITVSPLHDAEGRITGASSIARDITARKQAEEQLRKASHYTRTLIEASLDPLVTISREGKITDVNRATEEVTGVRREGLIGSDFSDYFSEPEKARVGYQQVFAEGFVQDYPLAIRHTSGRITDVLYNATVFRNQKGEVEGVFATARDISERKRAVKEIQRYTKELERSNAELQDFASIASHDLQEPLRKVLAFGEHLREHLGSNLDELGGDFLARMQNAAQRMSVLIEALLQYSRVTARAKPFVPVDLTQLVFGVLADMEDRITKTGAGVEFMPLPKVMADPMQMRQLLQNLLGNALKFRRPDTKPQLVIEGTRTNGWCEITVADNGIGFDEKYLDRIFRPFQRLHGRGYYEGSGMGLAICRKVVARHGGTLTAHSRPGEGSTFVVTLPAAALTHGRETPWQIEAEAKPSESCSPRTMTTISS